MVLSLTKEVMVDDRLVTMQVFIEYSLSNGALIEPFSCGILQVKKTMKGCGHSRIPKRMLF